jgi:nicotinate-nucleotide adenylyltransferase
MKKIGIYGGSFDPVHKGHRLLAENLSKKINADKVFIIPAAISPFKKGTVASDEDRLAMCELAFPEDLFEVSDWEIKKGGKSYTVDTLSAFKKLYPEDELYLFMGDDMLLSFHKWYKYEKILSLCTLVCGCRTGQCEKLSQMKEYAENVLKSDSDKIIICESEPIEISSTEIRDSLRKGEAGFIDSSVYEYIKTRGLYCE